MPGFCLSDETRLMLAPWLPRNTHTNTDVHIHIPSVTVSFFSHAHTRTKVPEERERNKMFRVPAGVGKNRK